MRTFGAVSPRSDRVRSSAWAFSMLECSALSNYHIYGVPKTIYLVENAQGFFDQKKSEGGEDAFRLLSEILLPENKTQVIES